MSDGPDTMADGFGEWARLALSLERQDRLRRRAVHTGLSVFENDGEGNDGQPDLRLEGGAVETRPPLRNGLPDGAGDDGRQDCHDTAAGDGRRLCAGDDGDSRHREGSSVDSL